MSRSYNNNAAAAGAAYNNYEEDENLAFLPADHPLMIRLQTALRENLEKEHERVHLQLKEKEAHVKKDERTREDVAVRLYEVQQNLAELHLTLEQTHQNYNLIQKLRVEAEQKLAIMNQEHNTKTVEVEQLEKNVLKTQDELSKLNRTLKQIGDYNLQMKSEIAVTRRTTYRAEENVGAQEKVKKKQDTLIDHLNEQKKKLNEQIVIIEAQLLAQKDETKAAQDILKEAYIEQENIIASKKNLLDRWQKSLLEMQRRDKALQVARDALKVQYELNVSITTELAGINNEIRAQGEVAETLAGSLNRLKMEERQLEADMKKHEHNREKLYAQIKILQQSLQSTEATGQQVDRDNRRLEDQMNLIEDNIMKIHTSAKTLIEQVIGRISEHKTLEKKTAVLLKQAQANYRDMEEKEIERENIENEVARVNIDTLNTTNQIEQLKLKKREVSEERRKKEETVTTYELEIRQGHDINEKKQKEVGKLNKLHDEIMGNASEMSKGPMDAHKFHLVNQVKEATEQVQRLERDWIKKQTNLVKQQTTLNRVGEEVSELTTQKTVLDQKKMRLNTIYKNHEKEIRNIKLSLKNLGSEMNKLNDGIAKNTTAETKLSHENFNIQSEFVEKLKELEKSNVKLEVDIDSLKQEKAELLQSIVEAERQFLLWERKMQLEKEIQEALDPEFGQSEIKELQKEIHRMELRLEDLRKRQEQTIQEMERAVNKRETIQLKFSKNDDPSKKANTKGKENKPQLARQIEQLRGTLAQTTKNNKEYDKKLGEIQNQMTITLNQMRNIQESTEIEEERLTDKVSELTLRKVERIMGVYQIVKSQTQYKGFDSIANRKFKPEASEAVLRQRYEKQQQMNRDMLDVLREVGESNPQFADVIQCLTDV